MLSAVVVNKQNVASGRMEQETLKGFIAAARELGLSITDEEAFLREQQCRVFEWAKPMGGSAGRNTRLP
jgi:5-methylcytosine-specific restriction protein B